MFQSPWKKDIFYTKENEITIASYNVEGFFWIVRNIQYDIKKIVEENNIDILCIQEHCEDSKQDSIVVKERFGLPHRCVFFNRQTAWANFGICGVIVAPLYVGFLIQSLDLFFLKSKKTPFLLALFVSFSIKGSITGGFNSYFYNINLFFLLFVFLGVYGLAFCIKLAKR